MTIFYPLKFQNAALLAWSTIEETFSCRKLAVSKVNVRQTLQLKSFCRVLKIEMPLNIRIKCSAVSLITVTGAAVGSRFWKTFLPFWNAQEKYLWSSSCSDEYLKKCCHMWCFMRNWRTHWCTISWVIYLSVEFDVVWIPSVNHHIIYSGLWGHSYFFFLTSWGTMTDDSAHARSDVMSCTWSCSYSYKWMDLKQDLIQILYVSVVCRMSYPSLSFSPLSFPVSASL